MFRSQSKVRLWKKKGLSSWFIKIVTKMFWFNDQWFSQLPRFSQVKFMLEFEFSCTSLISKVQMRLVASRYTQTHTQPLGIGTIQGCHAHIFLRGHQGGRGSLGALEKMTKKKKKHVFWSYSLVGSTLIYLSLAYNSRRIRFNSWPLFLYHIIWQSVITMHYT